MAFKIEIENEEIRPATASTASSVIGSPVNKYTERGANSVKQSGCFGGILTLFHNDRKGRHYYIKKAFCNRVKPA